MDRLRVRPMTSDDIGPLTKIWRMPEVATRWPNMDEEDVAALLTDPEITAYVIEVDGAVAGFVQTHEVTDPEYRAAGIDIMLSAEHQGQGLGPQAIRILARRLFDSGHHRLTIDPASDNHAARRAYEKVGFRLVGILRQYERDTDGSGWHDGALYDLLPEDLT